MRAITRWAKKVKLNANSPTTQRLYENRHLTVAEYVAQFRKGGSMRKMPQPALAFTVDELLRQVANSRGRVQGVNVRKILIDLRDKFER